MIAAIVLAAGPSKRMGKPKLILPMGGESMLERVLWVFRHAKVDKVVVVLGANAREVKREVKFEEEEVIFNPRHGGGMSGSLKLGLRAVGDEASAVMIALADLPFLSPKTVDKLVRAYKASDVSVVVPVYRGVRGHPVLFDKSVFPQIMKIKGDVGAKSVVEGNETSLLEVEVEDEGVVHDIDTPSDYEKVRKRANRRSSNQTMDREPRSQARHK